MMENKRKVSAIIQARMESTRFPGKILAPLNNEYALIKLIKRLKSVSSVDEIILSCPDTPGSKIIQAITEGFSNTFSNLYFYPGLASDPEDVLGRVTDTAYSFDCDIIVEITSDCPLVDPGHVDMLIRSFLQQPPYEYVSNIYPVRTWPDGLDVQVYSYDLLKELDDSICKPEFRQHVGWNIKNLNREVNYLNIPAPPQYCKPDLGLTLDTYDDWKILNNVFSQFGDYVFTEVVIRHFLDHPDLITNANVERKEPGKI